MQCLSWRINSDDLVFKHSILCNVYTQSWRSHNNHSALRHMNKINQKPKHTRKITPLSKEKSPETVRWSNSTMSTGPATRCWYSATNWAFDPSFTTGNDSYGREGFNISRPSCCKVYKLDWTNNKSDVPWRETQQTIDKSWNTFTGRNRRRGTLIPIAGEKNSIAAPAAISSWITGRLSNFYQACK